MKTKQKVCAVTTRLRNAAGSTRSARISLAAGLVASFLAHSSFAAEKPWDGAQDTRWGNNNNWTGGANAPAAGDYARFGTAFTNQPDVQANTSAGGIWMSTGVGQNVVISSTTGSTLQLSGGLTINGTPNLGILVDNTSAFTLTISAPLKVGASETWTNNSANIFTVSGSIDLNSKTLTVNGSGNTNFSGIVSDGTKTGSLIKSGGGTLTLSGANTYNGTTTVNGGTLTAAAGSGSALGTTAGITVNSGGTLLLGANNQINNIAPMTLAGGTFAKGNFSEGTAGSAGVGALTLTAAGSLLNFGTGTVGVLTFASFAPGAFTLAIDNWTGTIGTVGSSTTDRLIFNTSQAANLGSFAFIGYAGAVQFDLGNGFWEVVPAAVPELSTWIEAALAVGFVGFNFVRRCRRRPVGSLTSCGLVPSRGRLPFYLAIIAIQLIYGGSVSTVKASPTDEVSRAFEIASSTSNDSTSNQAILRAWRAVISRADERSVAAYVSEAVRLRPGLARPLVESALSVLIPWHQQRLTQRQLLIIQETIQAAIVTEPREACSVVEAALTAQPFVHKEIVAAALLAAPMQKDCIYETASEFPVPTWNNLQKIGHDQDYLAWGALNSSNIDIGVASGDRNVRSPEKGPE